MHANFLQNRFPFPREFIISLLSFSSNVATPSRANVDPSQSYFFSFTEEVRVLGASSGAIASTAYWDKDRREESFVLTFEI